MKHEHKGLTIEIIQDDSPESPREWDNLGTMVCFHRRYSLGDKHGYRYPEEVERHLAKEKPIYLPLYLMDHSGLSISTGDFGCPWDSGQVGVIYVNREKVLKEYSCKIISKSVREKVIANLKCEVASYDQYLRGDVWGYVVKSPDGEEVGSCWGFYGDEYALEQAKEEADYWIAQNESGAALATRYGMATA